VDKNKNKKKAIGKIIMIKVIKLMSKMKMLKLMTNKKTLYIRWSRREMFKVLMILDHKNVKMVQKLKIWRRKKKRKSKKWRIKS
jgi:hypothetical protein